METAELWARFSIERFEELPEGAPLMVASFSGPLRNRQMSLEVAGFPRRPTPVCYIFTKKGLQPYDGT